MREARTSTVIVVYTFFVGGEYERSQELTDDEIGPAEHQGKKGLDGSLDRSLDTVFAAACG
jgi:hypothetical protein